MRQAGRSLPEYRLLKEKHSFLELVRTPELAAEVTLQPVLRFGFDAAVIFSDILVVPEAMGLQYHFLEKGGGIEMEFAVDSPERIRRLIGSGAADRLRYVTDALSLVRKELGSHNALIGFAGSPWTLARYMIEGSSSAKTCSAKKLFYTEPLLFDELMEKITVVVIEFLQMQISAGVDAVQIFDSNGDTLSEESFEAASGVWIQKIITALKGKVPVILYSKGALPRLSSLVKTGANILSLDWTQSARAVRDLLPDNVGVQGNLDPFLLNLTPKLVATETARILGELKNTTGHIFNLGHGVPPTAKLECIEALVETVRTRG